MPVSLVDIAGLGPIQGLPTVQAANTLGTTPIKVTLPDFSVVSGGRPRIYKVKIVNPNASNTIAWGLVARGAAAPTLVATYGANAGSHILPGSSEIFSFTSDDDLYLVGDAAALSFSVTSYLV
jgi:hypothetical protein